VSNFPKGRWASSALQGRGALAFGGAATATDAIVTKLANTTIDTVRNMVILLYLGIYSDRHADGLSTHVVVGEKKRLQSVSDFSSFVGGVRATPIEA